MPKIFSCLKGIEATCDKDTKDDACCELNRDKYAVMKQIDLYVCVNLPFMCLKHIVHGGL